MTGNDYYAAIYLLSANKQQNQLIYIQKFAVFSCNFGVDTHTSIYICIHTNWTKDASMKNW